MKEKIRRAINRWHKPYNKTGMPDWADGAAAEIAKQVVSRNEYEAETAILGNRVFKAEARLVVMTEALAYIAEYNVSPWWAGGGFHLQNKAKQALSAVPKVVWSGKGETSHHGINHATVMSSEEDNWRLDWYHIRPVGDSKLVKVIVLADENQPLKADGEE